MILTLCPNISMFGTTLDHTCISITDAQPHKVPRSTLKCYVINQNGHKASRNQAHRVSQTQHAQKTCNDIPAVITSANRQGADVCDTAWQHQLQLPTSALHSATPALTPDSHADCQQSRNKGNMLQLISVLRKSWSEQTHKTKQSYDTRPVHFFAGSFCSFLAACFLAAVSFFAGAGSVTAAPCRHTVRSSTLNDDRYPTSAFSNQLRHAFAL